MPQVIIDISPQGQLAIKGDGLNIHQVLSYLQLAQNHVNRELLAQTLLQTLRDSLAKEPPRILTPELMAKEINISRRG